MNESVNMRRMYLERSLHYITQQEIPVVYTDPAYMLFVQRKIAASKYLNEILSEVGKEELLHYIEYCNEQIKKSFRIMKDTILKWWNREWSNWEQDSVGQMYYTIEPKQHYVILKRTSNDGLVEYKKVYKGS